MTTEEPDATPICAACGYPTVDAACDHCGGSVRAEPDGPTTPPGPRFFLAELLAGFLQLFQAGTLLFTRPEFHGKLRGPVLANLVAVPLAIVLLWWGFDALLAWAASGHWGWFEWLRTALDWGSGIVSTLLALLCVYLLLPVIVETATSPFLEPLADATEKMLGGPRMRPVSQDVWRTLGLSVAIAAKIFVLQLGVLFVAMALSFCGLGLVFAIFASAYLSALVWFDIPFARRGYPLARRRALLRRNWARALGFGLAFQVGMLVPFFNILLLTPAAAVATSMSFLRFAKP